MTPDEMGGFHGMGWMVLLGLGAAAVIVLILVGAVFVIFRPLRGAPSIVVRSGVSRRLRDRFGSDKSASIFDHDHPLPFAAFVVIPDISGYTRYLRPSCLHAGHAQFLVGELLEAILDDAGPRLIAAKLEGDAVLFYAPASVGTDVVLATGEEIAGAVDAMLAAFYRRRKELMLSNACRCNCCQHISDLELKVIVDYGEVSLIEIYGTWDISGMAVIRAHRLLKNSVPLERYILVSEDAAVHVGFPDRRECRSHVETFEDFGAVTSTVYELTDTEVDPMLAADAVAGSRVGDFARKIGVNLSLGVRRG